MDASSHSPDPLERMFSALRAEYGGKIDGDLLARTLRAAYQHAECLGMLTRPRLVEREVRDVIDGYLEPEINGFGPDAPGSAANGGTRARGRWRTWQAGRGRAAVPAGRPDRSDER